MVDGNPVIRVKSEYRNINRTNKSFLAAYDAQGVH
jgi:hypothetical protein